MRSQPLDTRLKAALEYGPVAGFLLSYLILRTNSYVVAGTEYTGLVVVIAAFLPIFLIAMVTLWYLEGRIARIQLATTVMLLVFGGLSVWLNDPRLFKMKPTVIYLVLALILSVGLLRGQSWLKVIMEDMIPLKPKGWMILTKRVTVLFYLSAAANELVWRTQPENVWVIFETLVMPVLVVVFFLSQMGLYVEYVTLKLGRKRR